MVQRLAVGAAVAAALLSLVHAGRSEAREVRGNVSSERLGPTGDGLQRRVTRLTERLEAMKPTLGLGGHDGFAAYNRIVDRSGRTHVRYHQTYRGVEVYNGTVLGHLDAEGSVLAPDATVQKGIDLEPAPLLDEAAVRAIVAGNLRRGRLLVPIRVRPIVFPTRYQDGAKLTRDVDGRFVVDPVYGVFATRKKEAYRWAFLAGASQATETGIASTGFVVDALTGEVLKKWDARQYADTPSVGTGHGQYNGTVELDTLHLTDGSGLYTLVDTTRATQPYVDPMNLAEMAPQLAGVGSRTFLFDAAGFPPVTEYTDADDDWGNGEAFDWSTDYPDRCAEPVGQTAAVDVHYGVQVTWDYLQNVLGRAGADGEGSSLVGIVHPTNMYGGAATQNAWDTFFYFLSFGDGGPGGPLTTLDLVAHEVGHAVMTYTANLDSFGFESAALNEANSDIHATMVKHYRWGAAGTGSVVPEGTTEAPGGRDTWDYLWTIGPQLSADGVTPLRWLYRPSKSGLGYDAWFDGVGIDDPHLASGPAVRAFFFLSQGASDDPEQETYSAYLPSGMSGIGNDKAIRIWYDALTTRVTDVDADYHAVRDAMVASASELFPGTAGADSAEVAAVKNAFAAVNVGAPAGAPEPVRVVFGDRSALWNYRQAILWPAGIAAPLPDPVVTNAADTSVTWSLGGLSHFFPEGGRFEDGNFIAPHVAAGGHFPVTATSNEDPKQFAVTLVIAYGLDADSDFDVDACDLGALASDYAGVFGRYPSANLLRSRVVEERNIQTFLEAFNNAFER